MRRAKRQDLPLTFTLLALAATPLIGSALLAPVAAAQVSSPTVGVGAHPLALTYDSKKGEVFVGNYADGTVSVISDATNAVVATVTVGSGPFAVAYDPGKNEIFVANELDDTVSVISDSSNAVVATLNVGTYPLGLAYDASKGEMFVANSGDNTVSVISDSTDEVVATVQVGYAPFSMAYDSGKGEMFVCNFDGNSVSVISDSTDKVLATIPVGYYPAGAAYYPAKGEVFVSNELDGTVSVINDTSNFVSATLEVGDSPLGTVYDPSRGVIFVANYFDSTLSEISASTNAVLGTVTVGHGPIGIAYDSGKGELFVADFQADAVSVVSDKPISSTYVSCFPLLQGGYSAECEVFVIGDIPSGSVILSSNGSGTFSPSDSCTLTFGTCSLGYSTDEVGLQVITAQYSGDANNAPSDGTIYLRTPEASLTILGCNPAFDPEGSPTTCTVNVSGFFPTGTVLFWSNGSGEFPSGASCTLTLGSCSVTYVPFAAGTQTLFAWYEGDSNNLASSGWSPLTVGS